MKPAYLFCALLSTVFASCSKGGDATPEPVVTINDTVGRIFLETYKFAQGYDTTDNYIAKYGFAKRSAYNNLGTYIASNSSGTHRVRYVGAAAMFSADSVYDRGGTLVGIRLSHALKGMPLFEVYDIATNQLYKRYIASKDSVIIDASFSAWDNYFVSNKKIAEAFLYYINVKQTDAILYRKN